MELIPNSKYFRYLRCNFSKKHFVVFGETSNFALEKEAHPITPQGKSEIEYLRVCVRVSPTSPPQGGVVSNEGDIFNIHFSFNNFKITIPL